MSTLTIRMPDATHARLRDLARARGVSINKLIEEIATATLSAHDAEVRFRLLAARGNPKRALAILDRLAWPRRSDHSGRGGKRRGRSRGAISRGVQGRERSVTMSELTNVDLIWNRACAGQTATLLPGDRALAALLLVHGLAMNGGVLHAVERATPHELDDAKSGYRFFGFDDVVAVLTEAKALVDSGVELDSFEADLDKRYSSLANDSVLFDRFAAHQARSPSDFSPL
jgi:hypothetical protein